MTVPLTWTLDAMDELVQEQTVPTNRLDAIELLDVVHRVDDHLHGLHDDLAECLGPIDTNGRCEDCGRLVARVHKPRGCMMAIPLVGTALWLYDHAESLPFLGKQLWLWKRRRIIAARPARIDSPPALSADGTEGER